MSEGTKETSDEEAESAPNEQVANSINIPEDYIPKSETEQTTNTLNLGGNDLGKEIGSTSVFLFIALFENPTDQKFYGIFFPRFMELKVDFRLDNG